MTMTSVATPHEETDTGIPEMKFGRKRIRSIILDTTWAKALGVRKTAGKYRIRSDELQARLFLMQELPGFSASGDALTRDAVVSRHNLETLTMSGRAITN